MAPFARAFAARGGDLRVCCLKSIGGNPFEAELRAAGVPVTNLGARNLRDLGAFQRLLRLLREERIGLVHAHLAYASIWGALACRMAGIPCVATLHVAPSGAPRRSREGVREALMVRALDRWAARVIAVSGAVREAWIERGGLDPAKIAVLGNGVRIEAFAGREGRDAVRRELGIEPGAALAATVSVLREGKGLEVLLDALPAVLASHPAARFLIAGDGPLREALAARAAGLGLEDRVIWPGFRRDVPALLAASDLFVLPSLEDAYPTALMEAMAAASPSSPRRPGASPRSWTIPAPAGSSRLETPEPWPAPSPASCPRPRSARPWAGPPARRRWRGSRPRSGWSGWRGFIPMPDRLARATSPPAPLLKERGGEHLFSSPSPLGEGLG